MKHHLYERATDPAAPTLILVPGLDGTALLFFRQIESLSRRFNVVALPLPDDPTCTMPSLVEDLAKLAEEVSESRIWLCGESFGGALSLSFALAYPGRLAGLVILNSFPWIRHARWRLFLGPPVLRALPWAAMPLVRRFTEHRLHSPHATPEDLHEFRERSKSIGREGYIRRVEILRTYDIRDRLHEIEAPALFLASDRDRLIPSVREARFMSSRVRHGTLRILEGYGHVCLIDRDLDLLSTIEPWLDRVDPKSGLDPESGPGPAEETRHA